MRPDVPVIMITAYGDPETKRKAIEGGATGLLTKPIDFALLREEIDSRLQPGPASLVLDDVCLRHVFDMPGSFGDVRSRG